MTTTGVYHIQYSTTTGVAGTTPLNASHGYLMFEATTSIGMTPITGKSTRLYTSTAITSDIADGTATSTLTNCGSLGDNRKLTDYVTFASVSASPLAVFALTAALTTTDATFLISGATIITNFEVNINGTISYSTNNGTSYSLTTSTISYNTIAGPATDINNGPPFAFYGNGTVNNCFLEGTKLYAHVHDKDSYVNIEDLREGDLVNTYLHGKKAIKFIGKDTLFNNPDKWNGCLKKLPKLGDMTDDLYITGAHSILVDELSEKESEGVMAIYGTTDRKIDDKFMLNAWVSEKAEPVLNANFFTIYHVVLEHDDDEDNKYGIWANGLLTESQCEKHFLKGTNGSLKIPPL
jgi:hypothetical protein